MTKKSILVIGLLLLIPFFAMGNNGSSGLVPCSGIDCSLCDIFTLLANVIAFMLITVVPLAATLLFMWGGVKFLTAGGDAGKVNDARKLMVSVVIGIVIVYSAHMLISAFLSVMGADVNWPNIDFCD